MNQKAYTLTCQVVPTVDPNEIAVMIKQRLARGEHATLHIETIQPTEAGGFVPVSTAIWAIYCGIDLEHRRRAMSM